MAENKIINLKINSNFEDSEKQVKSLSQAIKVLDNEATNLDATFEEVYGDLKPLTARMGEAEDRLYELAKAGKQGSQEYKDLLRSVGEYKKVQQQTDLVVDAAAQTMSSKLSGSLNAAAGGFSLVQGSMALFGAESSQVQEAILKVQAAMAISQGVETINEGAKSVSALGQAVKSYSIVQKAITAGQWLWNAAMAANPIGAIVAVVVALVAAGYALINMFISSSDAAKKSEAANKALNKELETQVKNQKAATQESDLSRDSQLKMAKASGKSAAEIRKLSVELANQEVTQKMTNAQTLRAIAIEAMRVAGLEDSTEAQKETAKNALKAFNDANEALKSSVLNRRKLLIDNKVAETQEQTDLNKEANNKAKEAADKAHQELKDRLKKEAEDLIKFKEEIAKNARDKQRDESFKAQDDIDAARKANADSLLTAQELAIQNENEAYKLKYDAAVKAALDTEDLELQHLNNLNNINLTEQEKAYGIQKAIDDKKAQEDIDREKLLAEAKKNIQDATFANIEGGIGLLKGLFEKNKGVQKAAMIAESALGIAKIVVNTQTANAVAAASPINLADPTYSTRMRILNTIGAGIGIASNIAATAKGLSALGGGGAPSGGSMGSAGGGGGAAPQFNVVGNAGVNQLAETMNNKSQSPIQAFVVAQNVTTAQSLNRNIVSNASLG